MKEYLYFENFTENEIYHFIKTAVFLKEQGISGGFRHNSLNTIVFVYARNADYEFEDIRYITLKNSFDKIKSSTPLKSRNWIIKDSTNILLLIAPSR